jgi:hypothetical protein
MTLDDDDAQYDCWRRLSREERTLRVVLAAIEYEDPTHSECVAQRSAHRPLHVTQLWEDKPYGFALKLQGHYQSTWIVKLLQSGEIFDVVLVPFSPDRASCGVLLRTDSFEDDDCERRLRWIGAFRAFFRQRGLMPEAHAS